ncbi:hypothetical protein ED733_003470 [Metarhizium rileyi]|uniref:BZIP domain-containing protein n=1 Tax=Metarhizium rileyi (strain RCEF 4871) TaxID=1649241 RepID=A0A5C6G5I9_METRR|nr:hypothetical protein ED733_003470 [Metarhizium rileyi]
MQLEHKRAHDREAQRANRRRVKERITRLEQELEERRAQIGSSKVCQELLRRNRFLEERVARYKNGRASSPTLADSTPDFVTEGSVFFDYPDSTDFVSHDVYPFLADELSESTTQIQPSDTIITRVHQPTPVSLGSLAIGSSTASCPPQSTIAETPGTGTFHHANHSTIPACVLDASTVKSGLFEDMDVWRRSWNVGRQHGESRVGLQMQTLANGWDNNISQKMRTRYSQNGGCFQDTSLRSQHIPEYGPRYGMNRL